MRRMVGTALVAGMAFSVLAGCGALPDRPAGWGVQAMSARQDIAIAAINRAASSLQTAQSAAQVQDVSGVIRYLKDARRQLAEGGVAEAFPQRGMVITRVVSQIDQAIERMRLMPMADQSMATSKNFLVNDIVMPLQRALNAAEEAIVTL